MRIGGILLIFTFICNLIYCQEGVLYIKEFKENVHRYKKVEKVTDNNELHFYLHGDKTKPVGIYLTKYLLGYWNSSVDTFALNDSTLVVFINPFPDVFINYQGDDMAADGVQTIGIGPFISERDWNGKLIGKCIGSTHKGTMKVYFDNNSNVTLSVFYKNGKEVHVDYHLEGVLNLFINE